MTGEEWFAPAVESVTEKGIMTGLEGGLFGPGEAVTRATVITVAPSAKGSSLYWA